MKVLDPAGQAGVTESRTCDRHFLSLRDFSVTCQHATDQSRKLSCARDQHLELYGVEESLI